MQAALGVSGGQAAGQLGAAGRQHKCNDATELCNAMHSNLYSAMCLSSIVYANLHTTIVIMWQSMGSPRRGSAAAMPLVRRWRKLRSSELLRLLSSTARRTRLRGASAGCK